MRKLNLDRHWGMTIGVFSWYFLLLILPLLVIFIYSFLSRSPYGSIEWVFQMGNYTRAFQWLYLSILLQSVKNAFLTTFFCILLGFPMALAIARSSPRTRLLLLILILVPFWTNFVVRAFSIKVFLADEGPLNLLLLGLGWIEEALFLNNNVASTLFGMVTAYLPFMVLPLYVALENFDGSLIEAARDLGASSWVIVRKILVPLIAPGLKAGAILVFVPALGEFVVPDVMGGAKTMLAGNLINEQFLKTRDWPFGSALTMLLLIWTFIAIGVSNRIRTRGEMPQ